ncbi:MAG: serine protein kinase RIO [Candidatus Helarchaeota archaeon]
MEKKIDELEQKLDKTRIKQKRSEDLATVEDVIDLRTRKILVNLMRKKIINEIFGAISTGKEANVYRATDPKGNDLAVKIYRIKSAEIQFMWSYIEGDPRFTNIRKKPRNIVYAWAEKEFKNLNRAFDAKVRVPKPIISIDNVLVMEFIGKNHIPAPKLKDFTLKKPYKTFKIIINYIDRLYNIAHLVHGDLSEFNILMHNNKPVFIDISQAVPLEHPNSIKLLIRDIKNICWYFSNNLKLNIPEPKIIFDQICRGD